MNYPRIKRMRFWNQCIYQFLTRLFNDMNIVIKNLKKFEVHSWNTCIFKIDAYLIPGPVLLSQCWWPVYGIGKVFCAFASKCYLFYVRFWLSSIISSYCVEISSNTCQISINWVVKVYFFMITCKIAILADQKPQNQILWPQKHQNWCAAH